MPSDPRRPVLVIGATGQQGGAAARRLLARGRAVRALVRDPDSPAARALREAGASLAHGDLDDAESVRAAMADGVHGVFLALTMMTGAKVSDEGVAAELRRGTMVADLAARAGVGHFVYSSITGADQDTGIPYYASKTAIERRVHALGLPATILRPAMFMDNFATLTPPAVRDGELVLSLAVRPETRLRLISTHDIGAFAAIAFERPDRLLGHTVEIAGDFLPASEIAEVFGRARGLPARFEQTPIERLRAFDEQVAKMFEWLDRRDDAAPDLPALRALHPELMTLDAWLKSTTPWELGDRT